MTESTIQPSAGRSRRSARSRWALGWLDGVLLLCVAAALTYLVSRAGSVFQYRWNWSGIWPYIVRFDEASGRWVANLLLDGLFTTFRLAVWGILLAGVIGVVMGLARTSKRLLFRLIGGGYVMLIRNIPPIVFVFVFVYFIASQILPPQAIANWVQGLPVFWQGVATVLFGPVRLIDNFFLGLICLSVFSGAYVTEIVRGGIQSVPGSQIEAGHSLGLSRLDILRFIVLPQAWRNVLPPMAGQFIQLIKDSSLVSMVSIQELTFSAQDVQVTTQRVFEVLVLVAVVYFVICLTLSRLFARLERNHARALH
jgi:polar amino acid transport system permease protein